MNKIVEFEKLLFGEGIFTRYDDDIDFWIDKLVILPSIRPFLLDELVIRCSEYCSDSFFCNKLLKKSIKDCPALVYRLYKRNIIKFEDILPFLRDDSIYVGCYYYETEIDDLEGFLFNKSIPNEYDYSFYKTIQNSDEAKQYGFSSHSMEFCLKYDDLEHFREYYDQETSFLNWSCFEWSQKPRYFDLLSFSGYFGSLNCFRFLLMKGYEINMNVSSSVACSGNAELFQLCSQKTIDFSSSLCNASDFCNLLYITFILENGGDINEKNEDMLLY